MPDPRIQQLADLILDYSLTVHSGERLLIQWAGEATTPLVGALIAGAARRQATPVWWHMEDGFWRQLLLNGTEQQVIDLGQLHTEEMKRVQAYVAIRGQDNIFEMNDVPEERRKWYMRHYVQPVHMDHRVRRTRWCVMRYPNAGMAQLAETSLETFTDFYFKACLLNYKEFRKAMQPLQALMDKTDRVRITAPGTDLQFSIRGIPAITCEGLRNLPDGEVFTAPVRDSVNGVIRFNTPSPYMGQLFSNVTLTFKNGQIVDATCDGDSAALNRILDTDAGARYVGEFAVGFHPWIRNPMKDILFDEKIAGSIHFTPGQCYDTAPNGNQSAIHWDLVLIQRKDYGGGELFFDDILVRKDGRFVLPQLEALNPEHWGAPPL
jgi:aminopeptidase